MVLRDFKVMWMHRVVAIGDCMMANFLMSGVARSMRIDWLDKMLDITMCIVALVIKLSFMVMAIRLRMAQTLPPVLCVHVGSVMLELTINVTGFTPVESVMVVLRGRLFDNIV